MTTTVYSFEDTSLTLNHPSVGMFTFVGKGVGSASVTRANDITQHDVAADGSTMISKVPSRNGTLAIAIQQTSEGHKFLRKWYNYVETASPSEFAKASATLKSLSTGETLNMSGVTPQKRADAAYQANGQQVTWNLMCAKITG